MIEAKHNKSGIDKNGHRYTRKVNDDKLPTMAHESAKKQLKSGSELKKMPWYDEYKKYNLSKYPVGVPKEQVTVNLEGDIHSHSILKWKDPKTGQPANAYTPEFYKRNAEIKWSRMANVNSKLIDQIKTKADDAMDNGDDKQKQIGAIIKIISHTGLRIGSRAAFQKTKNRGVCTLNPENVKIDKNDIYFSFVGKSYKNNTSHINDAKLAKVLLDLKEKNSGENFLFNHDRVSVDRMFKNTFGFKKLKLKDMRTYIATSLAKDVLYEDKSFGKKLTGNDKENKKLIQGHLQKCYGIVSKKLNNTPIMARDSYIHPAVVQDWLIQLGANVDEFMKSMEINSLVLATPTLDQIIKRSKFKGSDSVVIDEEDEENCDEFPLQPWEV